MGWQRWWQYIYRNKDALNSCLLFNNACAMKFSLTHTIPLKLVEAIHSSEKNSFPETPFISCHHMEDKKPTSLNTDFINDLIILRRLRIPTMHKLYSALPSGLSLAWWNAPQRKPRVSYSRRTVSLKDEATISARLFPSFSSLGLNLYTSALRP